MIPASAWVADRPRAKPYCSGSAGPMSVSAHQIRRRSIVRCRYEGLATPRQPLSSCSFSGFFTIGTMVVRRHCDGILPASTMHCSRVTTHIRLSSVRLVKCLRCTPSQSLLLPVGCSASSILSNSIVMRGRTALVVVLPPADGRRLLSSAPSVLPPDSGAVAAALMSSGVIGGRSLSGCCFAKNSPNLSD